MTDTFDDLGERMAGVRETLASYAQLQHERDVWQARAQGAWTAAHAGLHRIRIRHPDADHEGDLLAILAALGRTLK